MELRNFVVVLSIAFSPLVLVALLGLVFSAACSVKDYGVSMLFAYWLLWQKCLVTFSPASFGYETFSLEKGCCRVPTVVRWWGWFLPSVMLSMWRLIRLVACVAFFSGCRKINMGTPQDILCPRRRLPCRERRLRRHWRRFVLAYTA